MTQDEATTTLREVKPKERFSILKDAIAYYQPKMVVVDGISDLMYNSNCIEEYDVNRAYARVKIGRAIAKGLLIERGGVLYLP